MAKSDISLTRSDMRTRARLGMAHIIEVKILSFSNENSRMTVYRFCHSEWSVSAIEESLRSFDYAQDDNTRQSLAVVCAKARDIKNNGVVKVITTPLRLKF